MPSGISLVGFAKVIKNSDFRKSRQKNLQRYMKRTPKVIHKTYGVRLMKAGGHILYQQGGSSDFPPVYINPACRILHRGQPSFHVAKAHS